MRNSTIGYTNQVVPVSGNYTFSPEDAIASLQSDFATGSTITLPGIEATGQPPNNGDAYVIADPQNTLVNGDKTLNVDGGGYPFLSQQGSENVFQGTASFGSLIFEGSVVSDDAPLKTAITFVFDATAQCWIVF